MTIPRIAYYFALKSFSIRDENNDRSVSSVASGNILLSEDCVLAVETGRDAQRVLEIVHGYPFSGNPTLDENETWYAIRTVEIPYRGEFLFDSVEDVSQEIIRALYGIDQ